MIRRKNIFQIMLFLFTLFTYLNSKAQNKIGYTIEGYIGGLNDGTTLYLTCNSGLDTVSKSVSRNGHFLFKGSVPLETEFYFIKLDTLISKVASEAFLLVNKKITLNGSLSQWPLLQVKGSLPQDEYVQLLHLYKTVRNNQELSKERILNEQQSALERFENARNKSDSNEIKNSELQLKLIAQKLKSNEDRINDSLISFVKDHPNSIYIPDLIIKLESVLQYEGMTAAYHQLTRKSQMSYYGQKLKNKLDVIDTLSIGKAPNFKGFTPEGDVISLKEVIGKGKYVLLDFWASWCKPCRVETPNIRKAYDLYHQKQFNVLSVSLDTKQNDWKSAIEKDTMPWFNLIDKYLTDLPASKMYNVTAIPATFLLDSNGTIIATELRGEALLKKLKLLLDVSDSTAN